ncbi:MAG TPA: class I SAM-dependent methyltransferase [Allosphingosinicella sp.]
MRGDDLQHLYDSDYAEAYDEGFLLGPHNQATTDFELGLIREALAGGGRWLDLGCGTGHVLAQFPGVARAGLDLATAMVAMARGRNPDALFVEQGDFRAARSEWVGQWDLVTCMWGAYCYVDSFAEARQLVRNMVEWTAPGGAILIPCIVFPGDAIPHRHVPSPWQRGEAIVHGYVWSWEDGDKFHPDMIVPHSGQFVEWLAPFFGHVRVVRYPTGRTAVLARERRAADAPGAPTIVWDEGTRALGRPALAEASMSALARELLARILGRRRWKVGR